MKKFVWSIVLSVFLASPLFLVSMAQAAGNDNTDPNAPLKKVMAPLKELEKIKKMNNDLSIKHFTELIQKNPKEAMNYAKRGKAYSGNKDYEKAMEDFQTAISLDSKLSEPYVGRAVVYLMKKDYDHCWEDVHKAESLGGKFWPSFMEALKAGSGRDK